MTFRPVAAAALLAGSLALSGCSFLPGGDEPVSVPAPAATASTDAALPNTAWTTAARTDVARGGTLRLAASAIPRNFNPQHADSTMSDAAEILAPTLGGAVRITADGGWQVDRNYADSVEVTDKAPLTIKVRLNRFAKWQGGTPITARDMVAFWKAQNGSDGAFKVRSTAGYEDIADVKNGGNRYSYTVKFKKPTADWPLYIYPRLPANVSSDPKVFNSAFKGKATSANGPFIVTSIDTKTGTITEEPNPRWWGLAPRLAKIVWRAADPAVQARAYVGGRLDAVNVEADTYPAVKNVGVVQRSAGLEWTQLTLNGARGPLKDVRVRRAVAHAINRDEIANRAARRFGAKGVTIGSVVYVPGQRGYRDSSASIDYDPAASARLLTKAGYAKNAAGVLTRKGQTLTLTMPVPAETPTNSDRAALVKRDLKKVGIQVRLRSVPADAFFNTYVIALDFDLVTFAWRGSAFPVSAAEPLFYPADSGQNFTGLDDDKVAAAFDKAKASLNDAKRFARVRSIDIRLLDDVPIVPIAATPTVVAVRKGLVNYGAAQFEQPDWTRVGFRKRN